MFSMIGPVLWATS